MPSFRGEPGYFGDVVSDLQSSTDVDTVAGLKALRVFWSYAKDLNPQMPQDFAQFLLGLQQALVPTSVTSAWPGYVGPYYPTKQDEVFKTKIAGNIK